MEVVGHGKQKATDIHMVIQLEFKFPNDPSVYKVGLCWETKSRFRVCDYGINYCQEEQCLFSGYRYDDASFKSALGTLNSRLSKWTY